KKHTHQEKVMGFDEKELIEGYELNDFIEIIDELKLKGDEFGKLYNLSASLDHSKFVYLHENYEITDDELLGAMDAAVYGMHSDTFAYLLKERDWADSYLERLMKDFSSDGDYERIEILCKAHPILEAEIDVEEIFNKNCSFTQEFYDARSKVFLDELLGMHLNYNSEEVRADVDSIIEAFEKKDWAPNVDSTGIRHAFEFDEGYLAGWLLSYANVEEKGDVIFEFSECNADDDQEDVMAWVEEVAGSDDRLKVLYGFLTNQWDLVEENMRPNLDCSFFKLYMTAEQFEKAEGLMQGVLAKQAREELDSTTLQMPPDFRECVNQAKSESQGTAATQRAQARRL
ncbi:hypothetical protein, partial [Stenotrophomonas maltophilia]|uniref:hypothetical protein n=1 Tax=Stenotrophomonas maltophilia TaxID=40324 RepID=UPI0039C3C8D7